MFTVICNAKIAKHKMLYYQSFYALYLFTYKIAFDKTTSSVRSLRPQHKNSPILRNRNNWTNVFPLLKAYLN